MPHKLLLSFWTIVTLFNLTADSNAQETLQPYPPAILHTFLDSRNVYPESVTVDQSSGTLIIGKRNENMLFRVDLNSREIVPVSMPAGTLNTPDGLFLEGNMLYVTQNLPKSIAVLTLSSDFTQAELERTINHPTFAFPTSVARFKNRLLVVSSQFDTAGSPAAVSGTQPPVLPFWVTEIRENEF